MPSADSELRAQSHFRFRKVILVDLTRVLAIQPAACHGLEDLCRSAKFLLPRQDLRLVHQALRSQRPGPSGLETRGHLQLATLLGCPRSLGGVALCDLQVLLVDGQTHELDFSLADLRQLVHVLKHLRAFQRLAQFGNLPQQSQSVIPKSTYLRWVEAGGQDLGEWHRGCVVFYGHRIVNAVDVLDLSLGLRFWQRVVRPWGKAASELFF